MTLRVAIVDDEPAAIEGLARLCERSGRVEVAGRARDGQAALAMAEAVAPDAMFLDINMPGLGGMAVARRLAALARPPLVVFVTAYDHFAAEAFDLAVVDYLLKPVEAARLERAIERLEARDRQGRDDVTSRPREFWAPSLGRMVRVPVEELERVEAERDYVRLVTAHGAYQIRRPISAIETRLDPGVFLRLHRSTIIRADRIRALRSLGSGTWAAEDRAGRQHRIGRSHLAAVRARLGL